MKTNDLLLLSGGHDWTSPQESDSAICFVMAIPCSDELGVLGSLENEARNFQSHVGWGGEPWFLSIRDDLLWLPSTSEMWVLCLEGQSIDDFEPLREFTWRRVWKSRKKSHSSTVAFRVTTQQELLRLESVKTNHRLMPYTARMFAFNSDASAAFASFHLDELGEQMLWGHLLDEMNLDALGLESGKLPWSHTIVCDDGAFLTGDPVFCLPRDLSGDIHEHFCSVASRHGLTIDFGLLTKATLEDLVRGRKAKTSRRTGIHTA